MGMMTAEYAFQDGVPELSAICVKITDICSLPVVVLETKTDDLVVLEADIAFECAQDSSVKIEVGRRMRANDPVDTQTVHLRGYVSDEPTLERTTELALEALGGTPVHAVPEEDRHEFDKQISELEHAERRRLTAREMRKVGLIFVFTLPLQILLWVMEAVWESLTSPFRFVWQKYQK